MDKEEKILKHSGNKNAVCVKEKKYKVPEHGTECMNHRPVVIGAGPAGLFCAYLLAREGYRPLVFERGKKVGGADRRCLHFWKTGVLDPASNVQFGEGGAGTFSDGKLNTLVKDPLGRNRFVLDTFVSFGAPEKITYENKPHIGTDILSKVIAAMREEILHLGGTFEFESCVTDIRVETRRSKPLRSITIPGWKRKSVCSHLGIARAIRLRCFIRRAFYGAKRPLQSVFVWSTHRGTSTAASMEKNMQNCLRQHLIK